MAKKDLDGLEICKLIIDKGADINYANEKGGWTALHFACALADEDLVNLLCESEELDFSARTTRDVRLNFSGHNVLIPAESTPYELSKTLLNYLVQINEEDREDYGIIEDVGSDKDPLIQSLSKIGFKVKKELNREELKKFLIFSRSA